MHARGYKRQEAADRERSCNAMGEWNTGMAHSSTAPMQPAGHLLNDGRPQGYPPFDAVYTVA